MHSRLIVGFPNVGDLTKPVLLVSFFWKTSIAMLLAQLVLSTSWAVFFFNKALLTRPIVVTKVMDQTVPSPC